MVMIWYLHHPALSDSRTSHSVYFGCIWMSPFWVNSSPSCYPSPPLLELDMFKGHETMKPPPHSFVCKQDQLYCVVWLDLHELLLRKVFQLWVTPSNMLTKPNLLCSNQHRAQAASRIRSFNVPENMFTVSFMWILSPKRPKHTFHSSSLHFHCSRNLSSSWVFLPKLMASIIFWHVSCFQEC